MEMEFSVSWPNNRRWRMAIEYGTRELQRIVTGRRVGLSVPHHGPRGLVGVADFVHPLVAGLAAPLRARARRRRRVGPIPATHFRQRVRAHFVHPLHR